MKIAVVNNFYPPRAGGSSHISSSLAERFARAGNEVCVITTQYKSAPAMEVLNGVTIYRVPSWTLPKSKISYNFDITFGLKFGNYKKISKILDEFDPDVIHQHGQFFDLTWQSGFWARKRNVKTVLTLHTRLASPVRIISFIFRQLDRFVVHPILILNKPNKVIAIDKEFIKYAEQRYGLLRRKDILEYISIGVDLEQIEESLLLYNRNEDKQEIIASLGHVIPLRDRTDLVSALPLVVDKHPEVKVRVIGGVYNDDFLTLARKLNVEANLQCIGAVQKKEVPKLLLESKMEIHDLQGFGVGIASLEAMACGIPVIMSVDPEYFPHAKLIDQKNYINVPLNDPVALAEAINRFLDDPEFAVSIGAEGRRYVLDNFDMKNVAKEYLELFNRLIY